METSGTRLPSIQKAYPPLECNYEIHDKEMLAIIRALQEWRAELEGLQLQECFNIYTEYRALEYFMTTKKLNARQARWAEFLSRFYFLIRYRPVRENTLADALISRPKGFSLAHLPQLHKSRQRIQKCRKKMTITNRFY